MKKSILVISTFFLFIALSFGQTPQTPQTPEKTKPTAKTEAKADVKKDSKEGCAKTCTMKKSSCCDRKGAANKDEKTPEKK